MIDLQKLREDPEAIAKILQSRGFSFNVAAFVALEEERKALHTRTQLLQNQRNVRSKDIGLAKQMGEDIEAMRQEVQALSVELDEAKAALERVMHCLQEMLLSIPNLPHASVPIGKDEESNQEVRRFGTPSEFNFPVKSHDELGEALQQLDFAQAVDIAGSRFVVMKKDLAHLHRALTQWMLDVHTEEHGYTEVNVPYIVNADSLIGTGQLPKFGQDLFALATEESYYLIPTAEVPVTNTVRNRILDIQDLPLRYVCHSPCFRSEAGSYGKDTKGMIRQHQFEKVELVWISTPEASYQALEELTHHAEILLQRLKLPYRVITLCSGDLGTAAAKTYDLEVWLPSQGKYREISSCSNTEAYQARRLKARFRHPITQEMEPVHTLNGSALAVGRTLVAIMENYQDKEGNIHIPEVLRPYMRGQEVINRIE